MRHQFIIEAPERFRCTLMSSLPFPSSQASPSAWIMSTSAKGHAICLSWWSHWRAGDTWK